MALFKITIKPVVKDRSWKISKVKAGRIEKTCGACGKRIDVGEPAFTLLKRTSVATNNKYISHYACIYGTCKDDLIKLLSIKEEELDHD